MTTVYLNGEYCSEQDAKISVYDRGFLFGDGVYEVVPVYNGRLHRFADHCARLQRSLNAIRIACSQTVTQWQAIAESLLEKNQLRNASLYLQITRGGVVGKRDHAFSSPSTPSVFAFVQPWSAPNTAIDQKGITAITVEDNRWHRCDIKAITLLANALARQQAVEAGADEAIFVRDGFAIEGSSSNLFAIINNTLITAPDSPLILSGITRKVILEMAQAQGWSIQLRSLQLNELLQADEVWVSSSLREIKAVTCIDQLVINHGVVGPRYTQMMQWFRADAMEQST